ncbi:MAG: hypothetical protein COW89_04700 [Nitrospinae bacterium CG22_combo_CG10-13_8_21_14_all_47_10]|nr:MAG: hypothetical protein COW89_04700 [Nitrospinae bacterium CG22_combo_CG10-13_8_21_14_all_47_10]
MEKNYSNTMSLPEWISFFVEFIVPDDLSEEITESFLRHLADLGLLVSKVENIWQWRNGDVDPENLIARVRSDLEELSSAESGFALAYFIGYKDLNKKPLLGQTESLVSKNINRKGTGLVSPAKPASDLSNLQIVKKVGKQLQPFLQIEESIVSRLVGKHVGKQDAQKLFHYMFGKVGSKAGPRVWEQLSRKRHR